MEKREKAGAVAPHQLIMQDRKCIELSGVMEVDSFDDTVVICQTSQGRLTVRGSGLHLQRLDLDGTALSVEGSIDSLCYSDVRKGGLFGRLLR